MKATRQWALILAMAVLCSSTPAFAKRSVAQKKQAAHSQYEKAEALREELHGTPQDERSRDEYTRVADAFRKVYYTAPTSSKADMSVLAVAELLAEMGRVFDDDKASQSAIGQYEFLRREYPGSRYRYEALFAIGQVYHEQIGDETKARETFEEFLKKYPSHHLAEQAKATLKQIDDQEKAAALEAKNGKNKKDRAKSAKAEKPSVKEIENKPVQAPSKTANAKNVSKDPAPAKEEESVTAKVPEAPAHNGKLPVVTGVRHWSTGDYTRVAIDLEDDVKFDSGRIPSPDRIYFDLSNTKLAAELVGKSFEVGEGFLRKIRVAQYTLHDVRVVLDVDADSEYSAFLLPNPYRLIVDIHGKKTASTAKKPAENASAASPNIGLPANSTTQPAIVATVQPPVVYGAEPPFSTKVSSKPEVSKANTKSAPVLTSKPSDEAYVTRTKSSESIEEEPVKKPASNVATKTSSTDSDSDISASPARNKANARSKGKGNSKSQPATEDASMVSDYHAAHPTSNGDRSLIRALGLKIGRIVIDAGHGGHDTGTVGPNGLMEKDLVLDVALRLGKLLEERLGAEVVYTRDDDTFIPLETRTAIANQKQADLFISIHANSSDDASARGVETYYLNFTQDTHALEVAARENAVSEKSVFQLQDLVKKIALKEKIEESREFASDIQKSLHSGLASKQPAIKDRGVKKAPFIVLIGANMPSILAEISFVSNPTDEKKLRTGDYRQKVADSLFKGVAQYAGGLSGIKVASRMNTPAGE